MAVFSSRLVIMISHDSFSFSYSNFSFSYRDSRMSLSDFPISHSDFSITHIDYRNSIGDFELIPLFSCLACHNPLVQTHSSCFATTNRSDHINGRTSACFDFPTLHMSLESWKMVFEKKRYDGITS